jgi:GTP-binding protein Era
LSAAQRCGFVALVGAPNAGKSTLLNRLVGAKVSIVTHKVQTTRTIVRAIATEDQTQLVFLDTPGIFQPKRKLDEAMVAAAWGGARDADIVLVILDAAAGITEEAEAILAGLSEVARPCALAINKIDRVRRDSLLSLSARANELARFEATFMISALTGDGCPELMAWLVSKAPEGPWHFAEDEIIDFPVRQLAAEITREKLFLRLHDELPYASHVETEGWQEKTDGSLRIEQVIYVERESQKKIVIGKGGQAIKAISQAARKEIADVLERPVHLFLFVKVRENWSDDPARLRALGLANDRS